MAIPKTGTPTNGRTHEIKVGEITLNCTDEVPMAPAMNGPSTEVQAFQGGDYLAVTVDGGYQSTTVTCEYSKENYDKIDQNRADGIAQAVTLGTSGFTGTGIVSVSEGPAIPANGSRIPTMTVQIDWITTKTPTGSDGE